MDRDLPEISVDLSYTLTVPPSWWADAPSKADLRYDDVMRRLHGVNIWEDPKLHRHLRETLRMQTNNEDLYGSPLQNTVLRRLIKQSQPKMILEVGVFRGQTSTAIARLLGEMKGLHDSFVLSMDTWLLDLRFAWGATKSSKERKESLHTYFSNAEVAGSSQMYFTFLSNVLHTNTSHRIIPLQTASSNGAYSLLAHKLRPDFMYIDASHSNPDVFLDYENFYAILRPGGIMAVDDVSIVPAVKAAWKRFTERHGLTPTFFGQAKDNQAWVQKPASAS